MSENKEQAPVKEEAQEAAVNTEETTQATTEDAPVAEEMPFIDEKYRVIPPERDFPEFNAGDTITVYYKIIEGDKSRVQAFKGDVIQRKGSGNTQTFTVRKISSGVGVERIFPLYSPNIEKIEVNKRGKVRRARLFYLRGLSGKKARIKERRS